MKRGLKPGIDPKHRSHFCRRNTCPDEEGTETIESRMVYKVHSVVETHAPMKRGLKHISRLQADLFQIAGETHAPRKRGLKPSNSLRIFFFFVCRNTCPDEEGTETNTIQPRYKQSLRVETHAPMKRGLKLVHNFIFFVFNNVETHAPMKRGLKQAATSRSASRISCRNTCPDEEGTETSRRVVGAWCAHCRNTCPDEEGTETPEFHTMGLVQGPVETHAPMKRGLK